jgi:bifunctional non-homologous end joining protein LigD
MKPQLATASAAAPAGDDWLHEIKYDGYRMLAQLQGGRAQLVSRNGIGWTERLPEIARALAALPVKTALLDGEVVHFAADGRSSFSALKADLSAQRTAHLVYVAFDLLHLDGVDLTRTPLLERKDALSELIPPGCTGTLRFSEHIVGNGPKFFEHACKLRVEGIVSKRGRSNYAPGQQNGHWLKVKCEHREEFAVIGWTPPGGAGRAGFGALLLGYYDAADGTSRQRQPTFRTCKIPLITRRSSTRGLPGRPCGRCGSIAVQASSEPE